MERNADDLNLLIAKGFIIALEDGIIVIRHWKQNNYIQNDRRKDTIYQSQLAGLTVNNGIYEMDTKCIQNVSEMDTQDSIGKNSKDKGSKGKDNIKPPKRATTYFPNDESLNQAFLDYLEMRKQIKKPMTDSDSVENVIQSDFMRTYRQELAKSRELRKIPQETRSALE